MYSVSHIIIPNVFGDVASIDLFVECEYFRLFSLRALFNSSTLDFIHNSLSILKQLTCMQNLEDVCDAAQRRFVFKK
jgi:hypothetical protein